MRVFFFILGAMVSTAVAARADDAPPSAWDQVLVGLEALTTGPEADVPVLVGVAVGWRHGWKNARTPYLIAEVHGLPQEETAWVRGVAGLDVPLVGDVTQGVTLGPRAAVFGTAGAKARLEVGVSAVGQVQIAPRAVVALTLSGTLHDGDGDGALEAQSMAAGLRIGGPLRRPDPGAKAPGRLATAPSAHVQAAAQRARELQGYVEAAPIRATHEPVTPGTASSPHGPRPSHTTWRTVAGLRAGSPLKHVQAALGEARPARESACGGLGRAHSLAEGAVVVCTRFGRAHTVVLHRAPHGVGVAVAEPLHALIGLSEADLRAALGDPGGQNAQGQLLYDRGRIVVTLQHRAVHTVVITL